MLWEILLLFLGAMLGVIFSNIPKWYKGLREHLLSRTANRRRALLENTKTIHDWLIRYYKENGNINDLFDCRIGGFEIKIPFLTRREWQSSCPIPYERDVLLEYTEAANQGFPVDVNIIDWRKGLGQVLFDNPALYIDRIEENQASIVLHVKSCDYFQLATSFIGLEEETFKGIRKNFFKRLLIRDSYIPSVLQVQKLLRKPYAIGCAVALALKTKDSYELLIHTRSHATVTFGGSKAVIPNFGLAPISGGAKASDFMPIPGVDRAKSHSLLYYNFIKEYLEELYNYKELINSMDSRKVNPFWFYDLPEAKKLRDLIDQGTFSLEFLGFGFDALNGNGVIALLGIINNEKHTIEFKGNLELNWETDERRKLEIEFVDIKSEDLKRWLKNYHYHTGAAFTIDRALNRLNSI